VVPKAASIAVLLNPNNPQSETQLQEMKDAALVLGHQLCVLNASTEPEIDRAFATIVQQRANALIVAADTFLFSSRDQVVGLAARFAVPAIYPYRELSASGGLMSYGTNLADAYRPDGRGFNSLNGAPCYFPAGSKYRRSGGRWPFFAGISKPSAPRK
jgi:putative tryptophan/tyrosine transport system substrate-binding protein